MAATSGVRPPIAELALGIVAVPADRSTRDNIRATWLRDDAFADGRASARFVIGSAACALSALAKEQSLHGDIAFVNASDCSPWHAGHKVHAWFQYALRRLPAHWYGKAEDDSMLSVAPLLRDLAMLRRARPAVHLYGISLQWIAHCRQHHSSHHTTGPPMARSWAARTCAQGCWLGRLQDSHRRPPRCERAFDAAPVVPGSSDCPILPCMQHAQMNHEHTHNWARHSPCDARA